MSVEPVRKALYLVAVTAFLFVLGAYGPAGAFENIPVGPSGLLLAQQSQDSGDSQSETPPAEAADPAAQDEEDQYDDEYDDEYEALKEAALDPYVMIRNAYVQNRNKLIAE